MSRWMRWGDRIVPGLLFDQPLDSPPGTCRVCGGSGVLRDQIDSERYDVLVPCGSCRVFCKPCNEYVKKTGHRCVLPVPEKEKQP